MRLRALAQRMASELGPKGIHLAHPVIDCAIDTDFIRSNFPDRYPTKEQGGVEAAGKPWRGSAETDSCAWINVQC